MNETYLTAVGRVATKPNLRFVGTDGLAMTTFRIACSDRRRNATDGTWFEGESLFLSVTCWRFLAEHVGKSLEVGDPVIVQGRLRSRQYEKDGRQNTVMELEASAVGPNLFWCTAHVTRTAKPDGADGRPMLADSASGAEQRVEAAVGA